jgi:sulfur carrier protein
VTEIPAHEPICVRLNGNDVELESGTTISSFIASYLSTNPHGAGVAVAIDRRVVPRSAWSTTYIEEGNRLEVITAAPGG